MNKEEIIAKIKATAKILNLKRVYLFGSYSRNEQNKESDVDLLLVISDEESEKDLSFAFQDKIASKDVAFDVLTCTESKLEEKIKWNVFTKNILDKGEEIYAKSA